MKKYSLVIIFLYTLQASLFGQSITGTFNLSKTNTIPKYGRLAGTNISGQNLIINNSTGSVNNTLFNTYSDPLETDIIRYPAGGFASSYNRWYSGISNIGVLFYTNDNTIPNDEVSRINDIGIYGSYNYWDNVW